MQLDPSKIQAFQDLPTPNSQVKLQSFPGLINYLQPFIPGLSAKTTFLCKQLAKWDWNPSTDAAFHCLKVSICQTLLSAILAYYDRSKPVVVQTDGSKYGLGATLLQSSCPIAFASKILTDAKTCYANIECECLSVCFSLEKFHTYIYGRHVIVDSDHKPLEMIQQKLLHAAPPQLQHMLLHMQKYDFTIWYKPSKDMVLTNHLSHFLSHVNSLPIPTAHNVQHLQLSTAELDIIQGSIECDLVYSTVYCLTLRGWPNQRQEVPHITRHFWGTRDELSINSGLLLKGTGVCIPPELPDCTLADLHGTHQGTDGIQAQVREAVYWPSTDADKASYVCQCTICPKPLPCIAYDTSGYPRWPLTGDLSQLPHPRG